MKVRAKWAIKTDDGWHRGGDVFQVDSTDGFADAVTVLDEEPKPVQMSLEEAAEAAAPETRRSRSPERGLGEKPTKNKP